MMSKPITKARAIRAAQVLLFQWDYPDSIEELVDEMRGTHPMELADAAYDLGWKHAVEAIIRRIEEMSDAV